MPPGLDYSHKIQDADLIPVEPDKDKEKEKKKKEKKLSRNESTAQFVTGKLFLLSFLIKLLIHFNHI